jgi:integrase
VNGSISRRCHCKDAAGRELGPGCPKLGSKHGKWEYRDRLPTTAGRRSFRRGGFQRQSDAEEFQGQVYRLLELARDDTATLSRLGDLIFNRTRRGGQLPEVDEVRRRLGIRGSDLDRSLTVAEWLEQWLSGKRKLRESVRRSYRQHLDHYLIPLLGHLPLDRLTPEHIADMFDLIDEWNSEIQQAREQGRSPALALDSRQRSKLVGVATQRRIFATLRNSLNGACGRRMKGGDRVAGPRLIDWNPCDAVEMPDESRDPARTWTPEQVGTFLSSCEGDPLHLLFRLVLLHGPRRGEAVGARWTGHDHAAKTLRVLRPLLQLGGRVVESTPKTKAGERTLYLDTVTNDGIKTLRVRQAGHRLQLGAAYENGDLIFCRPDGSPYPPDYVSRRFRELASAAGLPVIKLHEGRHTAATLRLEAGVDVRVVSEQLGHSTTTITQNLYQHVRRAVLDQATDAVIRLLPERKRATEAG